MGGAIMEDPSKKERIIPIRILKSPHVIEEEDEELQGEGVSHSKRHSLSVELDDGTLTETLGTSIPLGSSTMLDSEEIHTSSSSTTTSSSTSRTEHIHIEEIGLDTLQREVKGGEEERKNSTSRVVPISLPDGKFLESHREEETTSTTTRKEEFKTTEEYYHPPPPDEEDPSSMSVPIDVSNKKESCSEAFFSGLDELKDLPDWGSFPPAREVLPGNGDEKFIPIVLEKSLEKPEASPTNTPPRNKRHSQEILLTTTEEGKSSKRADASRPTVRFNMESTSSDSTAERRKKEETANEIHKIDEDISKIWKELKELDSEPRPGSSVASWPKTTNPPPRYPKQSPLTPHKVSVLESPKYTPIRESSLTRPGAIKSSPGSSLKSVKTHNVSNPFGPTEEASQSSDGPPDDSLPRKGSLTLVTSSFKPTPSFAQPLTIKGGVVAQGKEDEPQNNVEVISEAKTPPSSPRKRRDTLDKETQTARDNGKKENCSMM